MHSFKAVQKLNLGEKIPFQECNTTPKLPEKKVQSSAVCFHCPTLFLQFPSDFLCFSLCPGIAGICFVCENEIPGGIALGATGSHLGFNSQKEQAALGNPELDHAQ